MTVLLTDHEVETALCELTEWGRSGNSITREWILKDFSDAMRFMNAVAELAESADHHPDMLLHGWNKVRITLTTHSAGGITMNDVTLAREIDTITL